MLNLLVSLHNLSLASEVGVNTTSVHTKGNPTVYHLRQTQSTSDTEGLSSNRMSCFSARARICSRISFGKELIEIRDDDIVTPLGMKLSSEVGLTKLMG
jgi:hypothetical protein